METRKTWNAHRWWFTLCPIGAGLTLLLIRTVNGSQLAADVGWSLLASAGTVALLWAGSLMIELYRAPIRIDGDQQESLRALQDKAGAEIKSVKWEPGFEKAIRSQLDRMIPEVRQLLHQLVVYGTQTESQLAFRFGDGIIWLAEEEHLKRSIYCGGMAIGSALWIDSAQCFQK